MANVDTLGTCCLLPTVQHKLRRAVVERVHDLFEALLSVVAAIVHVPRPVHLAPGLETREEPIKDGALVHVERFDAACHGGHHATSFAQKRGVSRLSAW